MEDGFINCFDIIFPKQFFGKAGFKKLPSRKSRNNKRNFLIEGNLGAQGVNRLKTSVADIAVRFQTINENLIHRRGLAKDMINTQNVHYPPDIRFRRL